MKKYSTPLCARYESEHNARMGVTIRHLSHLPNEVEARTKRLITLSDGKPDDYDTYRGAYGIEDTRQALIEARAAAFIPFALPSTQRHATTCHTYTAPGTTR